MNRPLLAWFLAALTGVPLTGIAVAGCVQVYPPDAPPGTLLFPIALTLVRSPTAGDPAPFLLVANSDYDARYRQGTLQSFDLDVVAAAVDACAEADRPCIDTNTLGYLTDEVQIGPHTSGIAMSPRGDRVYLSIRSESDMTWIDIDPVTGRLDCLGTEPQPGEIEDCSLLRRSTPIATDCGREDLVVEGDVVSVMAGSVEALTGDPADAGLDWTMLVHRNGRASLFVDVLTGGEPVPTLVHVLTGLNPDATNAAFDAAHNLVWMTTSSAPASAVPQRFARSEVGLIGVAFNRARPTCSSAFSAGAVSLRGVDTGLDSRDVVFSSGGRFAHVLSRTPESFITLDTQGTPLIASVSLIADVTTVAADPARAAIGIVDGREIAMATSFSFGTVSIMDARTREPLTPVHGFQGPQDLEIDEVRGLAYVADFRDSVLRVIDLRPIARGEPPTLALQIGTVTPVRTL
jgi:DNA-binding beta-propeller fold protein YncE